MAGDKYICFRDLETNEVRGEDYDFGSRKRLGAAAVVIAPHGGTIEPRTNVIADSIAGNDFSFYFFKALKAGSRLHIGSHLFDEPTCLKLVAEHQYVVSIHGWGEDGERACIGGRDKEVIEVMKTELISRGIEVEEAEGALRGMDAMNITNRGMTGRGVQFELTMALRRNKALLNKFTAGVRSVLLAAQSRVKAGQSPAKASSARQA